MVKGCEGYNCDKPSIDDCNYCSRHYCARHLPQALTTSQAWITELPKDSSEYWELLSEWNRPLSHPCPNYTTWRKEKYKKDREEMAAFDERLKQKKSTIASVSVSANTYPARPATPTKIQPIPTKTLPEQNPYLHNYTEISTKAADELVDSVNRRLKNHSSRH